MERFFVDSKINVITYAGMHVVANEKVRALATRHCLCMLSSLFFVPELVFAQYDAHALASHYKCSCRMRALRRLRAL